MQDEQRQLWQVAEVECVMVSCCAGAELQVRRRGDILLRELYPLKSDLYERARALEIEYRQVPSSSTLALGESFTKA